MYSRGGAKSYRPIKCLDGIRASDICHTEGVPIATAWQSLVPYSGNQGYIRDVFI